MSGLPTGWVTTTIGDILQPQSDGKLIHQGWSPQCHSFPAGDGEWGVLKTTSIQDGYFQDIYNKKLPEDKEPKPRIEVRNGDLLMTNAGPRVRCGVTTLVKDTRSKLMLSGKMYRMRFDETCINPNYIEACFRSEAVTKEIDSRKTGISESGLNLTQARFLTVPIILCPYNEQIRIANKLDSIFAKVDVAQARLDKIPNILKRFRQSVLAAATSGELTDDDIVTWRRSPLVKLLSDIADCPHSTPKWTDEGKLCVRTTAFNPFKLDLSEQKTVSQETYNQRVQRLIPKEGDILYSREGAVLGIACQIPEGVELCLGQRMLVMRAGERIDPRYLTIVLNAPLITNHIRSITIGNAAPRINMSAIKGFDIPYPTLDEQIKIVRRVESLFTMADTVEKQYKDAKARIDRLTQSLLAKAFRGELVEQDPNDEPATQLLERIKQQQLNTPKSAKQTRNTRKKVNIEVVAASVAESDQPQSDVLTLLQKSNSELTAQQIMDKLAEQTLEHVDVLFTELKRLLDTHAIAKVGTGESCTFKAIKK